MGRDTVCLHHGHNHPTHTKLLYFFGSRATILKVEDVWATDLSPIELCRKAHKTKHKRDSLQRQLLSRTATLTLPWSQDPESGVSMFSENSKTYIFILRVGCCPPYSTPYYDKKKHL